MAEHDDEIPVGKVTVIDDTQRGVEGARESLLTLKGEIQGLAEATENLQRSDLDLLKVFERIERFASPFARQIAALEKKKTDAAAAADKLGLSEQRLAQTLGLLDDRIEKIKNRQIQQSQAAGEAFQASQKNAAETARLESVLARLTERYAPAEAAARRFADAVLDISQAEAKGLLGSDAASATIEKMRAELDASSEEARAAATETARLEGVVGKLAERFDPAATSAQRLAAALDDLSAAEAKGVVDSGRAAAFAARLRAEHDQSSDEARAAAAETERLQNVVGKLAERYAPAEAAARRFADAVVDISAAESRGLIGSTQASAVLARLRAEYDQSSEEARSAAAETKRLEGVVARLSDQLDPAAAAARRYAAAVADIWRAEQKGLIGRQDASAMIRKLRTDYENAATSAGVMSRAQDGASRSFSLLRNVLITVGLERATRAVVSYADAWDRAENRLRLVIDNEQDLRRVTSELFSLAEGNFASIEATSDLFSRLAVGAKDLKLSEQDLLSLTDTIQKSVTLSGAGAQAAEGAIIQFGQALSGDFKAAAQELNSVIEQTPGLADAIARGLGVTRGEIKQLAKDGALSTEIIIGALQRAKKSTDDLFSRLDPTLSQVGQTAENVGKKIANAFLAQPLRDFKAALADLLDVFSDPSVASGIERYGKAQADAWTAGILQIRNVIDRASVSRIEKGLEAGSSGNNSGYDKIAAARQLAEQEHERLTYQTSLAGRLEITNDKLREAIALQTRLNEEAAKGFHFADGAVFASGSKAGADVARFSARQEELRLQGVAQLQEAARRKNPLAYVDPKTPAEEVQQRLAALANPVTLDPLSKSISEFDHKAAALAATLGTVEEKKNRAFSAPKERFDEGPLVAAEAALRRQIEAAKISDEALSLSQQELEIEAEIARIKEGAIVSDEKALRARLLENKQLEEALKLENERAGRRQDIADLDQLIAAARLGEQEYELVEKRLQLEKEIRDIKTGGAIAGVDTAEDEAAAAEQARKEAQLDRLRQNFRSASFDFDRDLARVVSDFVDALFDKGSAAFKDLARSARDIFFEILLDPIKIGLENLIRGFFGQPQIAGGGGIFTPGIIGPSAGGAGGGGLAGGFGGLFSSPAGLAQAALGIGGLSLGGAAGTAFGLTSLLGAGSIGKMTASIGNFLGLAGKTTDFLAGGLSKLGTVGGALGGIGGSLLSGAIFGNSKAQSLGSTIGGIAGSFIPIPIIGPLIGSFLGGALGSLFSNPSNKVGQVVFDPATGATYGTATKDQSADALKNLQIAQQVQSGVSQALSQIIEATGGGLGGFLLNVEAGNLNGIRLGQQGPTGEIVDPKRFDNTEAGAQQAVEAGVRLALSNLSGGDETITKIVKALADANAPLDQIGKTAATLKSVLGSTSEELSEWAQKIKAVGDAIDPVIAQTKALGVATADLEAARRTALEKIGKDFDKSIAQQKLGIDAPAQARAEEILDAQIQRLKDAKAVSLDQASAQRRAAEVLALNTSEWKQFIEAASGTPQTLNAAADALVAVAARAQEAGVAVEQREAVAAARASLASAMNEQETTALLALTNAPLARFQELLKAQKARIDAAASIGADVRLAQTRAGAERAQFFSSLSDEDKIKLGDFLGLIEDYTGRMGVVLSQTRDLYNQQVVEGEKALAAATDLASEWERSAKSLDEAVKRAEERYGAGTTASRLTSAQTEFDALLGRLRIGDRAAADDLPNVAENLLALIDQGYGTTEEGRRRKDQTLKGLREADSLARGYQSAAASERDALQKDQELKAAIQKALESPNLSLPYLQQQVALLDQSSASGKQLVALLTEYLDLSARQAATDGLGQAALQLAAEQYLGAAPSAASSVDIGTLTTITPTAAAAAQNRAEAALAPTGDASAADLLLAQTQLLAQDVRAAKGVEATLSDFVVRADSASIQTISVLDHIDAATRATPNAVAAVEAAVRETARAHIEALAGEALSQQEFRTQILDRFDLANAQLGQMAQDVRKLRVKLVDA